MSSTILTIGPRQQTVPLVAGDKLQRAEFLRRWEAMPELKNAELIGGIVYMPSPLSVEHAEFHAIVTTWLSVYSASTAGCQAGDNATWYMQDDAPQPDAYLRILPEYGGRSRIEDGYGSGAPELAAEICRSSTSYDLNQKRDLYEKAGVGEYVALLVVEREIRWHRLVEGIFVRQDLPEDGVFRSVEFPGLWLNAQALLQNDVSAVLESLKHGLATAEHSRFEAALRARRD